MVDRPSTEHPLNIGYFGDFFTGVFASFVGGVASIRRNASSNPIPGSSSSDSFGLLGKGLALDCPPELVPGDLGAVGEALAFDAFKGRVRALHIVYSESDPVIPAEVELRGVPLQVLLGNAVEGAIEPALEDRKA